MNPVKKHAVKYVISLVLGVSFLSLFPAVLHAHPSRSTYLGEAIAKSEAVITGSFTEDGYAATFQVDHVLSGTLDREEVLILNDLLKPQGNKLQWGPNPSNWDQNITFSRKGKYMLVLVAVKENGVQVYTQRIDKRGRGLGPFILGEETLSYGYLAPYGIDSFDEAADIVRRLQDLTSPADLRSFQREGISRATLTFEMLSHSDYFETRWTFLSGDTPEERRQAYFTYFYEPDLQENVNSFFFAHYLWFLNHRMQLPRVLLIHQYLEALDQMLANEGIAFEPGSSLSRMILSVLNDQTRHVRDRVGQDTSRPFFKLGQDAGTTQQKKKEVEQYFGRHLSDVTRENTGQKSEVGSLAWWVNQVDSDQKQLAETAQRVLENVEGLEMGSNRLPVKNEDQSWNNWLNQLSN